MDPGFLKVFKGSYNQIILGWILMILQELSSFGGSLHSPSALVSIIFVLVYLHIYKDEFLVICVFTKILPQILYNLIELFFSTIKT